MQERKELRLVEAALNVSEYTDKIDILSYHNPGLLDLPCLPCPPRTCVLHRSPLLQLLAHLAKSLSLSPAFLIGPAAFSEAHGCAATRSLRRSVGPRRRQRLRNRPKAAPRPRVQRLRLLLQGTCSKNASRGARGRSLNTRKSWPLAHSPSANARRLPLTLSFPSPLSLPPRRSPPSLHAAHVRGGPPLQDHVTREDACHLRQARLPASGQPDPRGAGNADLLHGLCRGPPHSRISGAG